MDLNSSEPTFQPGVEESGSILNIGRILDKNINESLRLWPVSLCSYPTQLCTVRDHAHSYVNIRHSRFHILPPPIELFSGGSTPWYIHPQEDRPREEDYTGSGNQFGVIWEGNLRVPATQSVVQKKDHSLCMGTSPWIHGILITQGEAILTKGQSRSF